MGHRCVTCASAHDPPSLEANLGPNAPNTNRHISTYLRSQRGPGGKYTRMRIKYTPSTHNIYQCVLGYLFAPTGISFSFHFGPSDPPDRHRNTGAIYGRFREGRWSTQMHWFRHRYRSPLWLWPWAPPLYKDIWLRLFCCRPRSGPTSWGETQTASRARPSRHAHLYTPKWKWYNITSRASCKSRPTPQTKPRDNQKGPIYKELLQRP